MSEKEFQADSGAAGSNSSPGLRRLGRVMRLLLVLALLGAGGYACYYWLTHRPKTRRRPPQPQAVLVETTRLSPRNQTVVVHAMGTVVPVRTMQLASRVSGQVIDVSAEFVPGGRFQAGARILQVEPRDYELAVQQRSSELTKAQSELSLEMGQQSVARREYELLGQDVRAEDEELLLRKPQLATAEAAVAAARAALQQAQLDLKRTEIRAPYNAMVVSRNVDLGSQVSVGTPLASLVGTDEYWVPRACACTTNRRGGRTNSVSGSWTGSWAAWSRRAAWPGCS